MMAFEQLRDRHCALVDGPVFADALSAPAVRFLTSTVHDAATSRTEAAHGHCALALTLLARVVVYDTLVHDVNVAPNFGEVRDISPLFECTRIPDQVVAKAKETVEGLHPSARVSRGEGSIVALGPGELRDFLLAGNSLLYLEASAAGRLPYFLSTEKATWIEGYRQRVRRDLFAAVEETVDAGRRAAITEALGAALVPVSVEFELPPLGDYILRVAEQKHRTPLGAALWIREQASAEAFRRWLRELAVDLLAGGRVEVARAARRMNDLRQVSGEMASAFDPRRHVDHKPGKVVMGKFPVIGWVFELFGKGEKTFDDKIVSLPEEDQYLAFIADWYS